MNDLDLLTSEDRLLLEEGVAGTSQGRKAVGLIDELLGRLARLDGLETRVIFLENRLELFLREHGQEL